MEIISKAIANKKPLQEPIMISDEVRNGINSKGYTLAQWWIINMKTNPPEYLRHDPTIQGKFGNTAYMIWIQILHTEPPAWMRHAADITNYMGDTAELVWYKFSLLPVPPYIKSITHATNQEDECLMWCEYGYTTASILSNEKQAKAMLKNQKVIRATLAYTLYKQFCYKYNISPMSEVELHELLTAKSIKTFDEDNYVIYKYIPKPKKHPTQS